MDEKEVKGVDIVETVEPLQSVDVKPKMEVKLEDGADSFCTICNMEDICYCDYYANK